MRARGSIPHHPITFSVREGPPIAFRPKDTYGNPWVAAEDREADAWEALLRPWTACSHMEDRDRANLSIRSVHNALISVGERMARLNRDCVVGQGFLESVEDHADRLDEVEMELAIGQIALRMSGRQRLVLEVLRRLPRVVGRRRQAAMLATAVGCCVDTARRAIVQRPVARFGAWVGRLRVLACM